MAALDSFKQMRDELAAGAEQKEMLLTFKGKGLKLNSAEDADSNLKSLSSFLFFLHQFPIFISAKEAIKQISMATTISALELTGNTVGSEAAGAIAECLAKRTEMKVKSVFDPI